MFQQKSSHLTLYKQQAEVHLVVVVDVLNTPALDLPLAAIVATVIATMAVVRSTS